MGGRRDLGRRLDVRERVSRHPAYRPRHDGPRDGGPATSACGAAGFTGDIDLVQVYGRTLGGPDFAAGEPVVHPTLEIESVEPLQNQDSALAHVRIDLTPVRPGALRVFLSPVGGPEMELSQPQHRPVLDPAGGWPVRGGSSRAMGACTRYGCDTSRAWGGTPAEATTTVDVARTSSQTLVGVPEHDRHGEPIAIAGEPITVSTGTKTDYALVPTGTIELYEVIDGQAHLLASIPGP